eukprot:6208284-Pleurochrysis_carterae.AAC.1
MALARERGKEVKELKNENKGLKEEMETLVEKWQRRIDSEVRWAVRQARLDMDAGVYGELAHLKEELTQAKRAAARTKCVLPRKPRDFFSSLHAAHTSVQCAFDLLLSPFCITYTEPRADDLREQTELV